MLTAAGLFKGNVFYGGNFTINISLSSSPTEAQKQRQSFFDIERVSFVEKLSAYFCRAFPPFWSVYFVNEYLRKTNSLL